MQKSQTFRPWQTFGMKGSNYVEAENTMDQQFKVKSIQTQFTTLKFKLTHASSHDFRSSVRRTVMETQIYARMLLLAVSSRIFVRLIGRITSFQAGRKMTRRASGIGLDYIRSHAFALALLETHQWEEHEHKIAGCSSMTFRISNTWKTSSRQFETSAVMR